jgi:hypothetical protein
MRFVKIFSDAPLIKKARILHIHTSGEDPCLAKACQLKSVLIKFLVISILPVYVAMFDLIRCGMA